MLEHLCRLDGLFSTDFWQYSIYKLYPLVALSVASSISERTRFAASLRGSPFTANPVADDSSTRIAHARARHQQLRQRVGEALASARMLQHVIAAAL